MSEEKEYIITEQDLSSLEFWCIRSVKEDLRGKIRSRLYVDELLAELEDLLCYISVNSPAGRIIEKRITTIRKQVKE